MRSAISSTRVSIGTSASHTASAAGRCQGGGRRDGAIITGPMRFGTFFFFQAAPGLTHAEVVHREIEQMEWTEELGFDQIWLTEHHFIDYGLAVDPASLAATAAARTRRVRIGLAAAILPFHHPLRLAEQLALIDIISKGQIGRASWRERGEIGA